VTPRDDVARLGPRRLQSSVERAPCPCVRHAFCVYGWSLASRMRNTQRLARSFEEDLAHARRITSEARRDRGLMTRIREIVTLPIRSQM